MSNEVVQLVKYRYFLNAKFYLYNSVVKINALNLLAEVL